MGEAPARVAERTRYYDIDATSVPHAWYEIRRIGPIVGPRRRRVAGATKWTLEVAFSSRNEHGRCRLGGIEVAVDIRYTLPRWPAADLARVEDQRIWDSFIETLANHEREHGDNGRGAAASIGRLLPMLESSDCVELERLAHASAWLIEAYFRYRDDELDRTTRNGTQIRPLRRDDVSNDCGDGAAVTRRDADESGAPPALTVLVVDQTGSMSGKPHEPVSRAIASAVNLLPDDAMVSLVVLANGVRVALEPTPVGEVVLGPDMWAGEPSGGAYMLEALLEVRRMLRSRDVSPTNVLIYSDGHIGCDGIPELIADLRARDTTISTLALAPSADTTLRQIAATGRGWFYPAAVVDALPLAFARAVNREEPPPERVEIEVSYPAGD